MATTKKSNNKIYEIIEVALVTFCLAIVMVVFYQYNDSNAIEDAHSSFASSMDTWDKQITSTINK